MNKRYNKSESRKDRPYNKSRRRRPHPPYDESKSRDRAQALEMERGDALDFDLKVPEVNWQLPTIPDIDPGILTDIPKAQTGNTAPPKKVEAPTTKSNPDSYREKSKDPLELPEFEVKPKQNKPQVKVAPKNKTPQSLGQKPKALTREQQIQREIQRRKAAQQQQNPQMQRNTQVHPAAVIGPVIILFIALSFLSTINAPAILYLLVLFFIGRHIWSIIQGGGQK